MCVSAKLIVKRSRTGLGLFSLERIKADQRIIEYTGDIISVEESTKRRSKYLFELDERWVIDGKPRSNTARYLNHSCTPNAKGYTVRNKIWIYSLRHIEAGEELTIDYGKDYFRHHMTKKKCLCETCII